MSAAERRRAVEHVREARRIHASWLSDLERDPKWGKQTDTLKEVGGGPGWHRLWVRRYDLILRVLGAAPLLALALSCGGAGERPERPPVPDTLAPPDSAPPADTAPAPVDTVPPAPAVDRARSRVWDADTGRLTADGRAAHRIRVLALGPNGRPAPGARVELRSWRVRTLTRAWTPADPADPRARRVMLWTQTPTDRFDPPAGTADAAGLFEARFSTTSSSTLLGDAVVGATAAGRELAARDTVRMRSAVAASKASAGCWPVSLGLRDSGRLRAVVRDLEGRPLEDVLVEPQTRSSELFRIEPPRGRTDAAGRFEGRVSYVGEKPMTTFVDVHADGLRTSATCVFVFR